MSSPTVDLCSSENSLSEDVTQELASRSQTAKDKNPTNKEDSSKSPPLDPKGRGSQHKKSVSLKAGGEEGAESSGQQQSSGRKKRSRATPAEETETNGRKSATDNGGKESSLWPGGEGEGPLQGSLLEEVLAEKRMALMRSPEVLYFLQQRQTVVQVAQQNAALEAQQAAEFSVGEMEEDARS